MGETGWDWVLNAFRLAREHFPDTRLMINDYNILGSPNNTQQYLEIIELLQAEDLIDGIGVQGHAFSTRGSPSIMTSNLDLLATTGLPIQVTEFDVDGPTDEVQLQDYQRIFPALWEHPAVEGITLWGWKPGLWRTEQGAYLVRADGTERPALEWLREYVEAQSVPVDRPDEVPKAFSVVGNYPNPFKGSTSIRYDVAETARLTLKVYDSMGRLVQTLVDEVQSPGRYTARFRAGDLASGTYLYRLETASFTRARPMILIK